jgi:hypothetical protein
MEAHLKRIKDDGQGWQNMDQLEDMRIIRDKTIRDENEPPAIMIGDFNVHYWKYGIMDEIFKKSGAIDAYVKVHGTGSGGETINWHANRLMQWFTRNEAVDEDQKLARIDYAYAKRNGAGYWLHPVGANVIRDWTYRADNLDLSDHYPLMVEFRLQAASAGCSLTLNQGADGQWQLSSTGDVGRRYELQSSPDLRLWERVVEFEMANSPHLYLDPSAGAASSRFYRLRVLEE